MARLHFLLLAMLIMAVTSASGDTIRSVLPEGGFKDFEGVTVTAATVNQDGSGSFTVQFPDGSTHDLPIDRAGKIAFGENGVGGSLYDLTVTVDGQQQRFNNTLVGSYSSGELQIQLEGEDSVSTFNMYEFRPMSMSLGGDRDAPAEEDVFSEDELFGDDSDSGADGTLSPDRTPVRGSDQDLPDDAEGDFNEDDFFDDQGNIVRGKEAEFFARMFSAALEEEGLSPGLFVVLITMDIIVLILSIINTIWLATHAFKTERIGWGITLLLTGFSCCCCLSPIKGFYVGKYDWEYRGLVNGLVMTEISLFLIKNVIGWTL